MNILPTSTTISVLPSGDMSKYLTFDLHSMGRVFEIPFFRSNTQILFPIGDKRRSVSSFVNEIFPVLYIIPQRLVNFFYKLFYLIIKHLYK